MELDKQRIAELVVKIQGGDNSAFNELYKLTSERAYFVALEFTKNNQDAEDILQESYMKALSKIKELDKPESFSSWLNQIVANKSKDFLKKKKPMLFEADENEVFEVLPDEDTNFSPEENLDQTELQKTVMDVLDELSEEKRACVMMMYFEELSVGQIAETLEIPEGTVKTRLFSARKDLKDKFAKRGITSTFSVAPIGVVIWAFRRASETASETFVGSGASAKVLTGITAAGTGTAASVAGTTAATTAAVSAGTSTATGAAATGAGIAAKIAALTVAQKIIAGVSVAAVVAGGTVGVVTVVNDSDKKDDVSTTGYTEEYTTAPSFETTLAVDAMATAEFSETTNLSGNELTASGSLTAKETTAKPNSTSGGKTTVSASETTRPETKTTKPTTTQKPTTAKATTTKKATTTTTKATTAKPTTTKATTTTTKATTTTTKPTTRATTRPATTRATTTTTKATTTTTKATTTTTTEATTLADPIVNITYNIAGLEGDYAYEPFSVSPGTVIDAQFIRDKLVADPELGFIEATVQSGDTTSSAESGKTYNFYVVGIKG